MRNDIALALLAVSILAASGCTSQGGNIVLDDTCSLSSSDDSSCTQQELVLNPSMDKLEIIHFHGTHQCQSCIDVGRCAEEAVSEYFSEESQSGLITFAHINGELPENYGLVQQYGVNSASLWIGTYMKDGTFSKEQNINVWYRTADMAKCKEYIKGVIEQKLAG